MGVVVALALRRYLVTGGAGFVGSHLVEALVHGGSDVRVLDNLSTGQEANLADVRSAIELVRGDVRDLDAVRAAMAGVDAVFHLAAIPSVARSVSDPLETFAVNVQGTQHVLSAALAAGVRRVVYASSAAIYGNPTRLPVAEDQQPAPLSPYGAHKLAGEHLCHVFAHTLGLETVALRYFNIYGPRQDPSSPYSGVISKFLEASRAGAHPVIYGDGEQTRDFVHVADVVRANLLAARSGAASGRAFNVGTGRAISLNELLRVAMRALSAEGHPVRGESRAGDIRHSVADITQARLALGYEPTVDLAEGLYATFHGAATPTS